MPSTLVKDLLGQASAMLQDDDPQYTVHPERAMVDALNDGQMLLAIYLPSACSRIDAVRLKPGTKQSIELLPTTDVKVDGVAPSADVQGMQLLELICNMGTDGLTPGAAIPGPIERRLLDQGQPNWHALTGTKVRQFVFDPETPRQFFVEPGVPAERLWVLMSYVPVPARIPAGGPDGAEIYGAAGASSVKISIGDENRMDLLNYICARMLMRKADSAIDDSKGNKYENLFVASLNARSTVLTGHNPNLKRLPMAPEPVGAAS